MLPLADAEVVVLEARLVLEGVELRHRPFHEDEDDPLRPGREVRFAREERAGSGGGSRLLLAQQTGESDIAEAGRHRGFQDLAASELDGTYRRSSF